MDNHTLSTRVSFPKVSKKPVGLYISAARSKSWFQGQSILMNVKPKLAQSSLSARLLLASPNTI